MDDDGWRCIVCGQWKAEDQRVPEINGAEICEGCWPKEDRMPATNDGDPDVSRMH